MGKRTMWLAIVLAMVLGLVSLPELQAGKIDDTKFEPKITTGAIGELRSLPVVEIPANEESLRGNLGSLRGLGNVGFQAVVDGREVTGHIRVSDEVYGSNVSVLVNDPNGGTPYTATTTISDLSRDLSQNGNIGNSIRLGIVIDGNYITSNLNRSTGNLDSTTFTPVAEVFSTHALRQDLALTNTTNPSIQASNSDIDFARESGLIRNVNRESPGIISGTTVISATTAAGDTIRAIQRSPGNSVTVDSLEVSSPEGITRARAERVETLNNPLGTALDSGVDFVGVTFELDGQTHYAVLGRVADSTGRQDLRIIELDHRPVQMSSQEQEDLIARFGGDTPTATATGIGWLERGADGQISAVVNSWSDNNGNWHTISGDAGIRGNPIIAAVNSGVLEAGIAAISNGDTRNARELGFSDGFIQAHQNIGIIDQLGDIDPERFQRYFGDQLDRPETLAVISTFSNQDQQVFTDRGNERINARNNTRDLE